MALATLIGSHRIYAVLRYSRLTSTAYALPRFAFLTIDSASLIRSAIDQGRYRALSCSASVARLWLGGLQLVTGIGGTFYPDGFVDKHTPVNTTSKSGVCTFAGRSTASAMRTSPSRGTYRQERTNT
jgi:hypothetical protein